MIDMKSASLDTLYREYQRLDREMAALREQKKAVTGAISRLDTMAQVETELAAMPPERVAALRTALETTPGQPLIGQRGIPPRTLFGKLGE